MMFRLIPLAKIPRHAREEGGFRYTECKANSIKLRWSRNECRETGDDTPGNHDAGNPFSRAELRHQSTARYFQQKITDKENTCTETVNFIGKIKRFIHLQCCK